MDTCAAPTVSVLLPVFDGAAYLGEALDSVLAQGFRDFELLVLDDGSRDASAAIARRCAAADPRVRVFSRENRGLVATLNELLLKARGRYVARMDADDVCLPDRFARQVAFLDENPAVVCVGSATEMIDERGRYLTTLGAPQEDAEIQREALKGHGAICHPSAMIRREALAGIGGYRAEFYPAEDLDLWLRLGEVGALANLAAPLLRYRLHASSISGRQAERQRAAAERGCRDAWRRRRLSAGVFEAADPWRPGGTRDSRHQFMLRFGWWAFNSGQRRTSLVYALKALRALPAGGGGWRLLACALLKPVGKRPAAGTGGSRA